MSGGKLGQTGLESLRRPADESAERPDARSSPSFRRRRLADASLVPRRCGSIAEGGPSRRTLA
eukprot:9360518-Pyramimonas_sp.AAC.1